MLNYYQIKVKDTVAAATVTWLRLTNAFLISSLPLKSDWISLKFSEIFMRIQTLTGSSQVEEEMTVLNVIENREHVYKQCRNLKED